MELNHYCWKIYRDTLFYTYYAILDDSFSLANLRLMKYRIKVKFTDAYARPGAKYVMHICRVRKRDEEDFLTVMEELPDLMKQCGYTQEKVAQRLCKSRPAVANLLRLLTLPESVIDMIRRGTLSAGHARVLAGLDADEMKISLANRTVAEGWSVRQLETAAALMRQNGTKLPRQEKPPRQLDAELHELENLCREAFGMRATLTGNAKKGKIVLQYYSQDELERLNDLLQQLHKES